MARGAVITVENSFIQGLVTEYTALNFPENAVTDGDNVVFSELGVVSRRNGIDYEPEYQENLIGDLTDSPGVFVEFKWDSVGGDGTVSFLVQQVGSSIVFFEVGDVAVSSNLKNFSINLDDYKTVTDLSLVSQQPCQFTFGKGFLFICHPMCDPIAVEYHKDTDTIEVSTITIEVRDFERLEDGLKIDERPSTLTDIHKYNLYNQGWYVSAIVAGSGQPRPVLPAWDQVRADFPSNADIWWVYKNGYELARFDADYKEGQIGPSQITLGNTPAPNGHYIYNAWNIDRSTESGIPNLPSLSAGSSRPSCVAFYAGRIFYAGISSSRYSDKIYFSQIIESDDQFGKCYQVNDPTSESIFDLVDSDGGIISIPLISKVVSLQVINDALIVIGTNGIFAIRGTENGPFRATDYSVEYVSTIGGVSHLSIVNVDNSLLWWNYDALYALTKDQIGVYYQVQNASRTTIQSVIDDVPSVNRPYIKGVYNKKDRIVQWLYSDLDDANPFTYNRILEFNVSSRAFYTHTISTDKSPRVVGLVSLSGQKRVEFLEEVVDNSEIVVTNNASDEVMIESASYTPNIELFKYTTLVTGDTPSLTYSNQVTNPIDWETIGGSSYLSFFESGYRIRGEILRPFNSTPIAVVLQKIAEGQVILKGLWDYGLRVTTPQWLYPVQEKDSEYIIRRVKLRGKGRSFQLRFESDGDSPFKIIGWSTFDTGGQLP